MSLTARRVLELPPYMFAEIDRVKNRMRDEGHRLLDFGVGDPDLPTPAFIVEAMIEAARLPRHHRYPGYAGMKSFRQAAADWCLKRHGVTADPEREVLALIGSKEGISHLPLALIDPGDLVLVTDPGYPVYVSTIRFAGGEVALVPLSEENQWLPDLSAIEPALAERAKMIIVNYPNNPIGATADRDFFERLIAWARKYNVFVMHDAAYIEVGYDGWRPPSLLSLPGGKEIGIEFHSLSKTFNMTGWRIGFAVGNPEAIKALATVKTQIDSGVFEPVQVAATLAYQQGEAALADILAVYQRRRDRLVPALRALGLSAMSPRGAFYIWTRVPNGQNSAGFARHLLENAGIVVMPGTGFGARGEGWFRFSLTVADAQIEEMLTILPKALG